MNSQQILAWGFFLGLVLAMLAIDLFVLHRKPHTIQLKEAAIGAFVPIALALAFIGVIYLAYQHHWFDLGVITDPQLLANPAEQAYHPTTGPHAAILYITGYLVELSLSADNVFLFVVLMNFFRVPPPLQHRVLFWGVLGALAMRAAMILIGGALLMQFHWIIYLFGAFLLFTGFKMFFSNEQGGDPSKSMGVRLARALLPVHPGFEGKNFFTRINGKRFATTLFVVLVCIEITDLVFALDSIPAIFGITKDTFLVFTSNVFAILGLRSMYFLLAGIMDKFHYLRHGLAFILAFVGIKMLLPLASHAYAHFAHTPDPQWRVHEWLSLAVIIGSLALSIIASLVFPCKTHTANPLESPNPTAP